MSKEDQLIRVEELILESESNIVRQFWEKQKEFIINS